MGTFRKEYGNTEGPLGLPMLNGQAVWLESLLRNLPQEDRKLTRLATAKAAATANMLLYGERADISWISTEDIDRDREIVLSKGMNEAHFKQNPIVTLNHNYSEAAVGRSLWRKRFKDNPTVGIKAKTHYPPKPADWPSDQEWKPDTVFAQIQAGLMAGKSIGFIRLRSHSPSSHEIAARPQLAKVDRIIDEWLLLEYAVCTMGTNQGAVVETVSKATGKARISFTPVEELVKHAQSLGVHPNAANAGGMVIPFTPVEEIVKHYQSQLAGAGRPRDR